MTNHYFLIDNSATSLTEIRTACFQEHAIQSNNNSLLSEVINITGTQRLIKVMNPSQDWILNQEWILSEACIAHWLQGVDEDDDARVAWENQL